MRLRRDRYDDRPPAGPVVINSNFGYWYVCQRCGAFGFMAISGSPDGLKVQCNYLKGTCYQLRKTLGAEYPASMKLMSRVTADLLSAAYVTGGPDAIRALCGQELPE